MFKDNYATVFYFRLVKNLGKPCAEVRLQAHTAGGLRVFCSFILMKSCMADAIINFTEINLMMIYGCTEGVL